MGERECSGKTGSQGARALEPRGSVSKKKGEGQPLLTAARPWLSFIPADISQASALGQATCRDFAHEPDLTLALKQTSLLGQTPLSQTDSMSQTDLTTHPPQTSSFPGSLISVNGHQFRHLGIAFNRPLSPAPFQNHLQLMSITLPKYF